MARKVNCVSEIGKLPDWSIIFYKGDTIFGTSQGGDYYHIGMVLPRGVPRGLKKGLASTLLEASKTVYRSSIMAQIRLGYQQSDPHEWDHEPNEVTLWSNHGQPGCMRDGRDLAVLRCLPTPEDSDSVKIYANALEKELKS